MKSKILKSGNEWVLRYKSDDIGELRRIATIVSKKLGHSFTDYDVGY